MHISITELKIYSSFYVDAKKLLFRRFEDNQSIKNKNIGVLMYFFFILANKMERSTFSSYTLRSRGKVNFNYFFGSGAMEFPAVLPV